MPHHRSLFAQVALLKRVSLFIFLPLLVGLSVVRFQTAIPTDELFRDPHAVMDVPPYIGALSNLGILFWCAATSISGLTAYVLWRGRYAPNMRNFLLAAALLTGLLMLDDLFLIHEVVAPDLGVPQEVVLAIHGLLLVALLAKFRQEILHSHFIFLGVAIVFFGLSMAFDLTDEVKFFARVSHYFFGGVPQEFEEDGSKLLGIVSWMVYFFAVSAEWLRPAEPPVALQRNHHEFERNADAVRIAPRKRHRHRTHT